MASYNNGNVGITILWDMLTFYESKYTFNN